MVVVCLKWKGDMNNLIKYNDGEIELKISIDNDNIWLSQLQISELFETSSDNIGLHLKNIYKEKELDENTTTKDFSVVRQEGSRKVKRTIKHYNLDAIICVGYRVNSYKVTKFRQWATLGLKDFHDRFLIIDKEDIYHLGASLKDLGNKVFAFSKLNIDINSTELLGKLK